ncbi:MAG: RagB/SusD family nutrient uptake outer membrane protein [Pelobium sp.]
MKKFGYKILLLITLFSVSSCNKWLDLKPEDGIIRNNFWKTKEQLNAAVIGCYSSLLNNSLINQLFRWGEMRGDMIGLTDRASINDVDIYEGNIVASNNIANWAAVYQTINYCNTVIEYGPDVINNDNTLSEAQLNAYLAEARGIRGLMYFYLLRSFGEVPLQLKAVSSDSKLEQLAKSSKEEVYKQIIDDLKFAEQNAVLSYGTVANNKGRLNKYTIYAILADAYLWVDDYQNCITYCDKIRNSKQFALYKATSQQLFFTTVLRDGNSQESIFELQFDSQKLNPGYELFASTSRPYLTSSKVSEYFGIDEVDPLNLDYRGDGASYRSADQSITKNAGIYNGADFNLVTASTSTAHWFIYRYSDILLMEAEAYTWTNKGTEALQIINDLRSNRNALIDTEEVPSSDDPEGISEYILHERSREFAFEGKRWYDMLRIAKRNDYRQLGVMIAIIAEAAPVDRQQSIINKYKDTRSHYLPINQNDLQLDKNLVQNPFYQ